MGGYIRSFFDTSIDLSRTTDAIRSFFDVVGKTIRFIFKEEMEEPITFKSVLQHLETSPSRDAFVSWFCQIGNAELVGISSSEKCDVTSLNYLDRLCQYAAYSLQEALLTQDCAYIKEMFATHIDDVYKASSELHLDETKQDDRRPNQEDYQINFEVVALTESSQSFSVEETFAC